MSPERYSISSSDLSENRMPVSAKFSREKPLSGDMEEHFFGAEREGRSVIFTDSLGLEWLGVFAPGNAFSSSSALADNADGKTVSIMNCGAMYCVDVDKRCLIGEVQEVDFSDVITHEKTGLFVCSTLGEVFIADRSGVLWRNEALQADELVFTGQSGDFVTGKYYFYSGDWMRFAVNVPRRKVTLSKDLVT